MKNTKNAVPITSTPDTLKPRKQKQTDEERFLANVGKPTMSGCQIWQGGTFRNGYGFVSVRGETRYAHRVAWEVANKQAIPKGMYVLHSTACTDRTCCAPSHLRLGDAKANALDRMACGRSGKGSSVTRKPFTKEETERLITLAASGHTQYRISKLLGRAEPSTAYALKKNAAEIQKKRAKLAVANALEAFNTSISVAIEQLQSSPLAA